MTTSPPDAPLPIVARIRNACLRLRTRDIFDFEWAHLYRPDTREFEITFFAERVPIRFDLLCFSKRPIRVRRLATSRRLKDDRAEDRSFGVRRTRTDDASKLIVSPATLRPVKRVIIGLEDAPERFEGLLNVKVLGKGQDDVALVSGAHYLASTGKLDEAIDRLLEYDAFATGNPSVYYWLADWHLRKAAVETAETYSLRALVRGNFEVCVEQYRSIQEQRPPRDLTAIRQLQQLAGNWRLSSHHGLMIIEHRQQFRLGTDPFHLAKHYQLLEIRRAAAARMLSHIDFSFAADKEALLHTKARVIRSDDEVENVPIEQFRIADQEDKNLSITTEDAKTGHWILPDLAPGDVIEWSYDLFCHDQVIDDRHWVFILAPLFEAHSPTYQARIDFSSPKGNSLRFVSRNGAIRRKNHRHDGLEVVSFGGDRFVPAKQTGFAFENHFLNPVIVCASGGRTWAEVAQDASRAHFGTTAEEDELPDPLGSLAAGFEEPETALAHAFRWIRDQLKYASTPSGMQRIGKAGWARNIIAAGVGNCVDKAYLLGLVCRRLEIPYQYVVVSTKTGIIFEETPANQFDHVFVRARLRNDWAYLDPSNINSTFGSPPSWCQGLRALVLSDEETLITIPVDSARKNTLEFAETFDRYDAGRLGGSFELRADGLSARLADQRWKALSLTVDDPQAVGHEALRTFLPTSLVANHRIESDTSGSDALRVAGRHARGPLVTLGENRTVLCDLAWEIPFLPLSYWRLLRFDRLFVVEFPMTVEIDLKLRGALARAVAECSAIEPSDDAAALIATSGSRTPQSLDLHRTIVFKRKFFEGDEVRLVPGALERIEQALRVVLTFRADLAGAEPAP